MAHHHSQNEAADRLRQLDDPAVREALQTDGELLEMYVRHGDRQAIEQLIVRYAPLVASVCRLTVDDPGSAEDAFQATFVVLLKSAKKIRQRDSVAAWLHGVAYRTASRLRQQNREAPLDQSGEEVIACASSSVDPIAAVARKMELEALDRELERLPEVLRAPLIEHYLMGLSAPQIAERMEMSAAAVEGRLKRGRRRLRSQLARRGISLSVLAAGSSLFVEHLSAVEANEWTSNFVDQFLPTGLEHQTVAVQAGTGANVSSLVNGELSMFSTTLLKSGLTASVFLAAGVMALIAATSDTLVSQQGDGSNRAATVTAQLPSESRTPQVVAQISDDSLTDGFSGGGGPVAGVSAGNAPPAVTSLSTPAGPPSAAANDQEAIRWQRPESAAGSEPIWLAGGMQSTQDLDRNRSVLAKHIKFDLVKIPLDDMAAWLSDQVGLQIELRKHELDLLGVAPDTLVSVTGSGSVRELLRRALEPLELTYRVTESNIEITTRDAAESSTNMRFYDLSYILPNPSNADAVINAIEMSIDPDSWLATGGTSSTVLVGSMMIVSAPDSTHQKIEILLINLSRMNPSNVEKAAATSPPSLPGGMGALPGGMGGGGHSMGGMF